MAKKNRIVLVHPISNARTRALKIRIDALIKKEAKARRARVRMEKIEKAAHAKWLAAQLAADKLSQEDDRIGRMVDQLESSEDKLVNKIDELEEDLFNIEYPENTLVKKVVGKVGGKKKMYIGKKVKATKWWGKKGGKKAKGGRW